MSIRDIPIRIREGLIKIHSNDQIPKYLDEVIDNQTIILNDDGKLSVADINGLSDDFNYTNCQIDIEDNKEIYSFYNNSDLVCIIRYYHIDNNFTEVISPVIKIELEDYIMSKKTTYDLNFDTTLKRYVSITRTLQDL